MVVERELGAGLFACQTFTPSNNSAARPRKQFLDAVAVHARRRLAQRDLLGCQVDEGFGVVNPCAVKIGGLAQRWTVSEGGTEGIGVCVREPKAHQRNG